VKLVLFNTEDIDFDCKETLAEVIPEDLSGKVLNYGQGEGQVEIERTVFGFYIGPDNNYYFQYEEGRADWDYLKYLVDCIYDNIKLRYGDDIELIADAPFTDDPDI